jgi:hypothetical protein
MGVRLPHGHMIRGERTGSNPSNAVLGRCNSGKGISVKFEFERLMRKLRALRIELSEQGSRSTDFTLWLSVFPSDKQKWPMVS